MKNKNYDSRNRSKISLKNRRNRGPIDTHSTHDISLSRHGTYTSKKVRGWPSFIGTNKYNTL
jgi:hypothetical protein